MTTYYVNGNLSTNGTGTNLNPFNSLQDGADALNAGDTLIIRPATYRSTIQFNAANNGTSSNRTKIIWEAGCVIDGQFVRPTAPPWGDESFKEGALGYAQGYLVTFRYCKHMEMAGNGLEIKNSLGSGLLCTGNPILSANQRGLNLLVEDVYIHHVRWQLGKADECDDVTFNRFRCHNGGEFATFPRSGSVVNWPNAITKKMAPT